MEDDQIFLHRQERYLEQEGGSPNFAKAFYLPTKADQFVIELRKWVNSYSVDPFPGETLPPTLSREKLLERYYSHTLKCSSCSKALANIRRLRMGCAVIGAIAFSSTPILTFWLHPTAILATLWTAITLASLGAWAGLGKLERRFYEGRDVPPRNLPEKLKKSP